MKLAPKGLAVKTPPGIRKPPVAVGRAAIPVETGTRVLAQTTTPAEHAQAKQQKGVLRVRCR